MCVDPRRGGTTVCTVLQEPLHRARCASILRLKQMCWNITVSALSACVGWATIAYLLWRKKSQRDYWYARYLLTFTFTQLVDIVLWSLNDTDQGLQACTSYQLQFGAAPEDGQASNFYVSKFLVPLVVFSQHALQCTYPSDKYKDQRVQMILLHLIPVGVMSFAFACSRVTRANFPVAHDTLFWGGDFTEWPYWLIQCGACMHSGIVALVMHILQPWKVAKVHNFVLACVVGTLLVTEGRMDLGSKWCTYCLVYSYVYVNDCFLSEEDCRELGQETKKRDA